MLNGLPDELFEELVGDGLEQKTTRFTQNVTNKVRPMLKAFERKRFKAVAEVFVRESREYWENFREHVIDKAVNGFKEAYDALIAESVKKAIKADEEEEKEKVSKLAHTVLHFRRLVSFIKFGSRSIMRSYDAIMDLARRHSLKDIIFDKKKREEFFSDLLERLVDIVDPILFYIKYQIYNIISTVFGNLLPILQATAKMLVKFWTFGGVFAARAIRKFSQLSFRGVGALLRVTGATAFAKSFMERVVSSKAFQATIGRVLKLGGGRLVSGAQAVGRGIIRGLAFGARAVSIGGKVLSKSMYGVGFAVDWLLTGSFTEAVKSNKWMLAMTAIGTAVGGVAGGVFGVGAGAIPGMAAGAKIGYWVGTGLDIAQNLYDSVAAAKRFVVTRFPAIIEALENLDISDKGMGLRIFVDLSTKAAEKFGLENYDDLLAQMKTPLIQTYLAYKKLITDLMDKIKEVRVRWIHYTPYTEEWGEEVDWKQEFKKMGEDVAPYSSSFQKHRDGYYGREEEIMKNHFKSSTFNTELDNFKFKFDDTLKEVQKYYDEMLDKIKRFLNTISLRVSFNNRVTYSNSYVKNRKQKTLVTSVQEKQTPDGTFYNFTLNGHPVTYSRAARFIGMDMLWNTQDQNIPTGAMQNLDIFGGKAFGEKPVNFNSLQDRKLDKMHEKTRLLERFAESIANYQETVAA